MNMMISDQELVRTFPNKYDIYTRESPFILLRQASSL
jgi:hypothetical protein